MRSRYHNRFPRIAHKAFVLRGLVSVAVARLVVPGQGYCSTAEPGRNPTLAKNSAASSCRSKKKPRS